jgi:hypothetical protein
MGLGMKRFMLGGILLINEIIAMSGSQPVRQTGGGDDE